jgi:PPM family protein phosphatase
LTWLLSLSAGAAAAAALPWMEVRAPALSLIAASGVLLALGVGVLGTRHWLGRRGASRSPAANGFRTARRAEIGGRERNEDAAGHAIAHGIGCWVVADGLGGHGHGDSASCAALESVIERFVADPARSGARIAELIVAAHEAVKAAQQEASYAQMRTTLAILIADGSSAVWAHVGDTRIYHFRGGAIRHQTQDHSVPQMLVAAGDLTPDEIRRHPDRSRILRALGEPDPPRPDVGGPVPIQDGDAFLLCSDGWWEYVTEREMELDLAGSESPADWLDQMTDRILSRAAGAFDNFTAVGVFVRPED